MAQIWRDELTRTQNIDGILLGWKNRASKRTLGKYLPVKEYNVDVIEMEIDVQVRGGVTPGSAIGAEPPVVRFAHQRGTIQYEIPVWKEMTMIEPKDIYNLRKLGSRDQLVKAQEILNVNIQLLEERLLNRFELMRHEFLFDKQVTHTDAEGNTLVYTYPNHPDFMNITAATPWSDPNASVHEDILAMRDVWFEHSTFDPVEVILPFGALRKMAFINEVQDFALNNYGAIKPGYSGITTLLGMAFGDIPVTENRDSINYTTTLAAPIAAAGTSLVLRQVEGIVVGSKIRLVHPMGASEIVVASAVNATTNTVTISPTVHAYAANDGALYRIWTIPLDKMLIMGGREVEIDRSGSQPRVGSYVSDWAEITSTRSIDASMTDPKPGIFHKTVDKSGEMVQYIAYALGGHFLPRLFDGTGFMVYKIF